jgi:hypothetical protein
MEKHRFPLPERQGQQALQDFFLFFPGSLDGEIEAHFSQGDTSGEFLFDEPGIGFKIDLIQTPGMEPHCGMDKLGEPVSQMEDFFIRCQVCPDADNGLDPGILRPFQGSLEVWNFIQVSMGVDELQVRLLPLSMLPHYPQPVQTGQGVFAFPKLFIRRLRRLRREHKEFNTANYQGVHYSLNINWRTLPFENLELDSGFRRSDEH